MKHDDVIAWHGQMGRRLRSLDPFDHLISSSFTGGSERPDLYALPEMDFSQYHSYNEPHPARMTAEKTKRFFDKYRKPFFVSEYGTDWKGWKPDTDPHFRALHQAIWSGAFAGAAGTGMTWWWETFTPPTSIIIGRLCTRFWQAPVSAAATYNRRNSKTRTVPSFPLASRPATRP